MNLTQYKTDDDIELYIDNQTGETYCNLRGLARMCDRNHTVISRFAGGAFSEVKQAEILTEGGLQGGALFSESQMLEVIAKYNPTLLTKFAQLGLRAFLHQMAGYTVKSTAVEPTQPVLPQTYVEALEALLMSEKEKIRLAEELLITQTALDDAEEDVDRLSEVVDELFDYSSIIRIAKYNNVSEKLFNWRLLKSYSTINKLEVKKVPCPRYTTKNLYHHQAWRYCYPDIKLPETTTIVISK